MEGRRIVVSIEGEFRRYKALAEGAIAQVDEDRLLQPAPSGGNSIAILVWHVSGNLTSRFTDFLTADGEKPWRQRDSEFSARVVSRDELLAKWEGGWSVLLAGLGELDDGDFDRPVTIRGVRLTAAEALHRALAHIAYHVGQIVSLARQQLGPRWRYLSIAPGGTEAYNRDPTRERAPRGGSAGEAKRR